jgi:HEXXH motif-containing protein
MIDFHRLDEDDLAELAAGGGGAALVSRLRDAQLSRHLLLLRYVARESPGPAGAQDAAIEALSAVRAQAPEVYAHALSDPLAGAWAAATTRRLRHPSSGPVDADLAHLGALAAAAAIRAGTDAAVSGYVRDGWLTLPGLADVWLGAPDGPVEVSVRAGRLAVAGRDLAPGDDGWREVRRFDAGTGERRWEVAVEEGNPYRDLFHAPPAPRMTDGEVAGWRAIFARAWDLICRFLPTRAEELTVGLRSLVPLADDGGGAARSCTSRDAFGAVGLTPPRSAVDLAITLVHEFQHSKLDGVTDLVPLYHAGGAERHFAPWRLDPRPTGGLFQGVSAFLSIAQAWQALRRSADLRQRAERELAETRELVAEGMSTLVESTELTPAGRLFVAGMRAAHERLMAEPLPAPLVELGRATVARRRAEWMTRTRDRGA